MKPLFKTNHGAQIFTLSLIFLFLSACEDSMEIEVQEINRTYFSPPKWILGSWEEIIEPKEEMPFIRSFEFTQSNFLINPLAREKFLRTNYNDYLNEMFGYFPQIPPEIIVEKNDSIYRLSITPPIITDQYLFKKIDEKTISCRHHNGIEFKLRYVEE